MSETRKQISEWIGDDGTTVNGMTDKQAEELLNWLESEAIDIEKDMDRVKDKIDRLEMERENGAVEFEGVKYILTEQAYITCTLLPDHIREDHFEMAASCIRDTDGAEGVVYWLFKELPELPDGTAPELDEYDYDDVYQVDIYD